MSGNAWLSLSVKRVVLCQLYGFIEGKASETGSTLLFFLGFSEMLHKHERPDKLH